MGFAEKTQHTWFDALDSDHQAFIRGLGTEYRLTHQEIRELCEVARDTQQWQLEPLANWWASQEQAVAHQVVPERKKLFFELCVSG